MDDEGPGLWLPASIYPSKSYGEAESSIELVQGEMI